MSLPDPLDALAFGPHPDDVELFCGGTLALLSASGYRVGVVDLTRGELATNGTPEERAVESAEAARVLGLAHRENLGLPDGFIDPGGGYAEVPRLGPAQTQLGRVVEAIRRLRPEIVLAPLAAARHPDHEAASALVTRAVFFAGVGGFTTEPALSRWAPRDVLYYPMRVGATPSLCVDVSAHHATKRAAIACYVSQLGLGPDAQPTLVNDPRNVRVVLERDRHWGAHVGVEAAEAFILRSTLGVADPIALLRARPGARPLLFPPRHEG